jgi:hypothetical protein
MLTKLLRPVPNRFLDVRQRVFIADHLLFASLKIDDDSQSFARLKTEAIFFPCTPTSRK